MKRTALALCIIMVAATVANAACYKCVNREGAVSFTDSPPQDAKCEWLASCGSTFSEELERENEAKDAISRSQWEEAEARRLELKQQELEAKRLELKQRELDAMADQARKEKITEGYDTVIHHTKVIKSHHEHRHPSTSESELKHKERDSKAGKDVKQNNAAGQAGSHPAAKITNKKSPADFKCRSR